ncbi:hypothetical protein DZA35_01015 [Arcobacter sp. HD9-500m-PIT-SAG03]|nr:hypothetical protein DZA35_01015 [Arcobacter sp. HD9-500m-PIT-SAG03]
MQSVKIVFKSILLSLEEQKKVTQFLTQHNNSKFAYNAIFDERERKNSVHGDINIWIVDKYDEKQSDKYHCIIRFYNLKDLLEEFETLIVEIAEIFEEEENPAINIKQSLLSNTDTKKYNLDRRGKGELDMNHKTAVIEEDTESRQIRLKGNNVGIMGLNPYKDLFK